MQRTPVILAVLAALLALSPGAGMRDARAQAPLRVVTCESSNDRQRECATGFREPARLYRNLSGTPCVEGRNWGSRPGMVWVDRGCRASFAEGRPGPGPGPAVSVRCESDNNRYRECPSPFRGRAEVRQQLSDARCSEGETWGQRRGTLWVDRGCRAEFGEAGQWGAHSNYAVSCASDNNHYRTCPWDTRQGFPTLIQQVSDTPCRLGESWGWTDNRLWVDHGCRGRFGPR
ncbi:MAG: DUF3011 domain-containing protein [Pseudoxanthomonas sp.]